MTATSTDVPEGKKDVSLMHAAYSSLVGLGGSYLSETLSPISIYLYIYTAGLSLSRHS